MKYVAIFVLVVLLVRIDLLMVQADKLLGRFREAPPVDVEDVPPKTADVIPLSEDLSLRQTPKKTILSLINNFRSNPIKELRERVMAEVSRSKHVFGTKLDKDLETEVFRFRDYLYSYNNEVASFLVDLANSLEGENLELVKRFFSLWMDVNIEQFLKVYSYTRDSACTVATMFGDSVVEEEKTNILFDRERALAGYINKENADPRLKTLASTCQLVLNLHLAKVVPKADGIP